MSKWIQNKQKIDTLFQRVFGITFYDFFHSVRQDKWEAGKPVH